MSPGSPTYTELKDGDRGSGGHSGAADRGRGGRRVSEGRPVCLQGGGAEGRLGRRRGLGVAGFGDGSSEGRRSSGLRMATPVCRRQE